MTDALVAAVARAFYAQKWDGGTAPVFCMDGFKSYWLHDARAALAEIEATGTHVVVPIAATAQMVGEWRQSQANGESIEAGFYRMLAARPEQEGSGK